METTLQAHSQSPPQPNHLQSRERQYRPEPQQRQHSRDRKGYEAQAPEKRRRAPRTQRAVRADLDPQRPVPGGRISRGDHGSRYGETVMVASLSTKRK